MITQLRIGIAFALILSVFMMKKLNKKRIQPPVPTEFKVDPQHFFDLIKDKSEEVKLSAQVKKILEEDKEETLEHLLNELEVPRTTVIVSQIEEVSID